MTDNSLPSSFDLWFDLKTRDALVQHYAGLKQEIGQIERIMDEHGLEFTSEEMAVISPEDSVTPAATTPKPF